jgi:four helix bundle protein
MNKNQLEIQEKCIAFAVKVDAMRRVLNKEHREYNKADQVDRSASAIGANYSEALCAESEADYIHKLGIAQKEANETIYWLKVIHRCGYIDNQLYESLVVEADELVRIITATILSLKKKQKNV